MFKVVIGLRDVAQAENLTEACQIFVRKVQELISAGGCSSYMLFEACYITATIDGIDAMMNFDAIRTFANEAGLLKDGELVNKPAPHLPSEIEKRIFLAAFKNGLEACLSKHVDIFQKI